MFGSNNNNNNIKRFSPIDDKDLKAVINFYRNQAREFEEYAEGLESGELLDRQKDVVEKFQHHINLFGRWIKFLLEA
jgi:hypothetical protein